MTAEVIEQEQQSAEVAQSEDAGFEAGFNEARGDEPSAEQKPVADAPQQEEAQNDTPQEAKTTDEQQQPLIAGFTEDQLKALLAKANQVEHLNERIEKAFSKYGELNRTIQQLAKAPQGGMKLNREALKRTAEQFPEFAELLATDLSEALSGASGGSGFDPSQFDNLIGERLTAQEEKVRQGMERRLLTSRHRDWESVVQSDDFNLWKDNVISPEDRQRLNDSWDADLIAEKLTEFKAWREKAQETPVSQPRETKQKRLEAAIAPTGGAAMGIQNTDDGFESGFNQIRSNRMY